MKNVIKRTIKAPVGKSRITVAQARAAVREVYRDSNGKDKPPVRKSATSKR